MGDRRESFLESVLRDARTALRRIRREPGPALTAIFVLALAIGASTAIFSVVDGVLLRPLPFREPARLVMVWVDNTNQGWPEDLTSYPTFLDWRESSEAVAPMAAFTTGSFALAEGPGDGEQVPERVEGALVSADFFSVLGVAPAVGRDFRTEEEVLGNNSVVILSHDLWQRRYGGRPEAIGSLLYVDGEPHEVVGVLPAGRELPDDVEVWAPLAPGEGLARNRGFLWLRVIGRLAPGVGIEAAQAEMDAVASGLAEQYPELSEGLGVNLEPLREELIGDVRRSLLVLLGAVGALLLIACADVAGLFLAQARRRAREIALQCALGAPRERLIRQLMTESLVLALLGGAGGVLLAAWGTRLLLAMAPPALPASAEIGVDGRVVVFALLLAAVTGVLFGLLPAFASARPDLANLLKSGSAGSGGGHRDALSGRVLVTGQIAVAVVLLVAAGLLAEDFRRLRGLDPGFEPEKALTLQLELPRPAYPRPEQSRDFYARLADRIERLPGVRSVAGVSAIFQGQGYLSAPFVVEGRPAPRPGEQVEVAMNAATPGLFRTLGIPLLEGRDISPTDTDTAPRVVVVSRSMAERYWPGGDPLGARIKYGRADSPTPWMEVVGVVGDIRSGSPSEEPRPSTYLPLAQQPRLTMTFVIRTAGDPLRMAGSLREVVHELDPNLPITALAPLTDLLAERTAAERFNLTLVGVFAVTALVLAALGIFSLLAYAVARKQREIGVRMALGADRGEVRRMILQRAAALALVGICLGLGTAALVTRYLAGMLYGISAVDPFVFGGVALVLLAVALLAAWLPALRATGIAPSGVLRVE